MSKFALIKNNVVENIVVAESILPVEYFYPDFKVIGIEDNAYISVNYLYLDNKFVPPKPFESWILDSTSSFWVAPIPMPEDEGTYAWDEKSISWVEAVEVDSNN